jgi:hypothetical protein
VSVAKRISGVFAFGFPLIGEVVIKAIFAVFPLFLLAAFFALLALFAAIAHTALLSLV